MRATQTSPVTTGEAHAILPLPTGAVPGHLGCVVLVLDPSGAIIGAATALDAG